MQEPKDKGTEQFELFESETNEWGIGCLCYHESAKEHERTLKQLVAEFPETTMWYSESETESGYYYLAKSNNGKLEEVVPWEVAVSTAVQDDFAQVLAYFLALPLDASNFRMFLNFPENVSIFVI